MNPTAQDILSKLIRGDTYEVRGVPLVHPQGINPTRRYLCLRPTSLGGGEALLDGKQLIEWIVSPNKQWRTKQRVMVPLLDVHTNIGSVIWAALNDVPDLLSRAGVVCLDPISGLILPMYGPLGYRVEAQKAWALWQAALIAEEAKTTPAPLPQVRAESPAPSKQNRRPSPWTRGGEG